MTLVGAVSGQQAELHQTGNKAVVGAGEVEMRSLIGTIEVL